MDAVIDALPEVEAASEYQTYRAEPGSLPARVVRYLLQFPTCSLTRRDIARMFGVDHIAGIDGSLQQAVARQVLEKTRNREDVVAWKLGTNDKIIFRDSARDMGVPNPLAPAHAPFGVPEFIRYMHIPILRSTPLDPSRRQLDEVDRWLDGFECGDSSEFSGSVLEHLRPGLHAFENRTGRKFLVMRTTGDRAGIERVA